MAKKSDQFEIQLKRLEEIVRLLEDGQLSLEESLRLFEEGVKLSKACHARLEQAERRVELLLADNEGKLRTQTFPEEIEADLPADPVDFDRDE